MRIQSVMVDAERLAEILRLRAQGMTYEQIGDKLGVTRQRVHAILVEAGQLPLLEVEARVTPNGVLFSADLDPDTLLDRLAPVLEGMGKIRLRRRVE